MSNILAVNNTAASSADQAVGTGGRVTIYLVDADGGYVGQDVQVNIELKGANNQYMRQGRTLGFNNPSYNLDAAPGTPFRVTRIAGASSVGVDAVGQA